jgi:hypothetical protein
MGNAAPPHWRKGAVSRRFADVAPSSYDADTRSVEAVLSTGSAVPRFYGTEVLRIAPEAVALDRLKTSGIPLLDSHQQTSISNALGRVQRTWFSRGALMGKLTFNDTPEGRKAEGMVARGEICGISAGYSVEAWEVTDAEGDAVDARRINFDDDLTLRFTNARWSASPPTQRRRSAVSAPGETDYRL